MPIGANQRRIQILIKYYDDYISLQAVFYNTSTANAIWDILPIQGKVQFWGDEMFFPIPVIAELEDSGSDIVSEGDLCFWPPGRCLCMFFGPTPISIEAAKIRPTGPVNRIGRLCSDYKQKIFSDVLTGDGVRKHYFIVPSGSTVRIQRVAEDPKCSKRTLRLMKFYILRLIQVLRNRLRGFARRTYC